MPRFPSRRTPMPRQRKNAIQSVAFVSLGCPKNLVDSEKMLGLLAEDGLVPVPHSEAEHSGADAVVVNTCGFLEASKVESVDEINKAAELKKAGKVKRLIVAGCLVQRHRAKLLDWCPDIDAMIGVFDRDRILEAVKGPAPSDIIHHPSSIIHSSHPLPVYSSIASSATMAKRDRHLGKDARGYFESDAARLRLTPRHYAYLRMSEGCNQNCAFCTIPSIRGKMRSKPPEAMVDELRELMADGAFEINLIGQDTTSYGSDIGYDAGLVGLLETLDSSAREFGGAWLRLMYAYPSCFTDAMIDAIARLTGVVKYIDIPLQHIHDDILDSMRRKTSRKLIEKLLDKLRKRVHGIAIRTTFITGFPGEKDRHHKALVKFVREIGFEAMGVFPYSPEPGTPAGTLHASGLAVPDEVIRERIDELMLTQQEVVFARNAQAAERGDEVEVLIDAMHEKTAAERGGSKKSVKTPRKRPVIRYTGRTYAQAPQIDAVTFVDSTENLSPGELVRCRITGHEGYDLAARPVAELEKRVSLAVMR
ncbi:MAG: 30S ribosomal protein S12 methylthiotransferase RimO [Phycisphaera sp.]|nr:30S ribosomal protein S12 methylthiotransferase RimO [Phycisphaera sp.]